MATPSSAGAVTGSRESVAAELPAESERIALDPAPPSAGLDDFVLTRLGSFGDYEDAISAGHDVLFHSVLSPRLNVGLLSPRQVVDADLAQADHVPLNSLEGFLRQVVG